MSIIGIGLDLVEVDRVAKAIERPRFVERVYTPGEIAACEGRGAGRAASYAARFAAKEAFLKALGTGLRGGTLQEIEVSNDLLGKPKLIVHGFFGELAAKHGVVDIHLSLTHTKMYAAAQCLLWGREESEHASSNSSADAGLRSDHH
nr:holo-ACP synthase [uncultured Anaeromusa sp.]